LIFRTLEEMAGTQREVHAPTFVSRRMLLGRDGMGFSFHDTVLYGGMETRIWYKHHLEAVYCIEGTGEIESLEDGKVYGIKPGTMYALDKHDRHILRAVTDLRMICVFTPPLTGQEVHDEEGTYPLMVAGQSG